MARAALMVYLLVAIGESLMSRRVTISYSLLKDANRSKKLTTASSHMHYDYLWTAHKEDRFDAIARDATETCRSAGLLAILASMRGSCSNVCELRILFGEFGVE